MQGFSDCVCVVRGVFQTWDWLHLLIWVVRVLKGFPASSS